MGITIRGLIKFFFMRAVEGIVVLLILLFLPNIPPFCKFETPYKVSSSLPLEGKLAVNEKLSDVEFWHQDMVHGPEAFASYNGELYTSLGTGEIVKLTGDKHISPIMKFGKPCKYFEAEKCGRPLGMAFDKSGALYAADAYYGIFKVDVKTGEKVLLVSPDVEINGKKPKLFNSLAIASTGEIYWTDSSTEFPLHDGVFDMLADGSGRVLKYDPKTKRNTVLMDKDLHFANGIMLSQNEDFLIISVTNRNLLYKYHLKGNKAGQYEVLIEGLPGNPDNIQSDGRGGILASLILSHDSNYPNVIQIFGPFPWIRKLISRGLGLLEFAFKAIDYVYPNDNAKIGVHLVGHFELPIKHLRLTKRASILLISENGEILDSFHTTNGKVGGISEAFIYKDELLLGSPFNDYIGRIPLSKLGLKPLPEATKTPPVQQRVVPQQEAPKPTPKPTEAAKPTPKPTEAPKPTPKPTEAPKPTPKPTEAPKPTPKPTEAPKPTPAKQTTPPKTAESPKPTPKPVESPKPTPAPKPAAAAPKVAPKPTEAPKQAPTNPAKATDSPSQNKV